MFSAIMFLFSFFIAWVDKSTVSEKWYKGSRARVNFLYWYLPH